MGFDTIEINLVFYIMRILSEINFSLSNLQCQNVQTKVGGGEDGGGGGEVGLNQV